MPAANATGRLVILAIKAAVSARVRSPGPRASVLTDPREGAMRIAVSADRTPAMIHAWLDTRRTEIVANRAASSLLATASMRKPVEVHRKRATTTRTAIGTRTRIM